MEGTNSGIITGTPPVSSGETAFCSTTIVTCSCSTSCDTSTCSFAQSTRSKTKRTASRDVDNSPLVVGMRQTLDTTSFQHIVITSTSETEQELLDNEESIFKILFDEDINEDQDTTGSHNTPTVRTYHSQPSTTTTYKPNISTLSQEYLEDTITHITDNSSISISEPRGIPKVKRQRNRYRMLPRAMYILRQDTRRQYMHMLVNVMNSYDGGLVRSFLNKFAAPDMMFIGELVPFSSLRPHMARDQQLCPSFVSSGKAKPLISPNIVIRGIERVGNLMCSSCLISPDRVITALSQPTTTVNSSIPTGHTHIELRTFSNSEYCELSGKFSIKATYRNNATPLSLAQQVHQRVFELREQQLSSLPLPLLKQQQTIRTAADAAASQPFTLPFMRNSGNSGGASGGGIKSECMQDREGQALASLLSQMNVFTPNEHIMTVTTRIRVNANRQIESIHFVQMR